MAEMSKPVVDSMDETMMLLFDQLALENSRRRDARIERLRLAELDMRRRRRALRRRIREYPDPQGMPIAYGPASTSDDSSSEVSL